MKVITSKGFFENQSLKDRNERLKRQKCSTENSYLYAFFNNYFHSTN